MRFEHGLSRLRARHPTIQLPRSTVDILQGSLFGRGDWLYVVFNLEPLPMCMFL